MSLLAVTSETVGTNEINAYANYDHTLQSILILCTKNSFNMNYIIIFIFFKQNSHVIYFLENDDSL